MSNYRNRRQGNSDYAAAWAASYIIPLALAAGAYALTHSVGFAVFVTAVMTVAFFAAQASQARRGKRPGRR